MTGRGSLLEGLAPLPAVDFAVFGEVEVGRLSRVQKLTGSFLGRNWVTIPHVTHFDEVDITALEAARASLAHDGAKLSPLPFLVRAVVSALKAFPQFNASIDARNNAIVFKKYFHIGIATDTPQGLLVPVVRDADTKNLEELAGEISDLAERSRTKGLPIADMSGGCFTISSLGALGGTGFTPIINAPELAILGVSRARDVPVRGEKGELVWRRMLPLSLSYDHRAINGADAGRFIAHIAAQLGAPESL
jgi:pyruvate dehydrogenase E2 component (dihydrolipoamide acetyltransferase)